MLSFAWDTSNMNRKMWVMNRLRLLNKWIQLFDSMEKKDEALDIDTEGWYKEKASGWYAERESLVDECIHMMCMYDHTFDAHGNCVRCGTHIGAGV